MFKDVEGSFLFEQMRCKRQRARLPEVAGYRAVWHPWMAQQILALRFFNPNQLF